MAATSVNEQSCISDPDNSAGEYCKDVDFTGLFSYNTLTPTQLTASDYSSSFVEFSLNPYNNARQIYQEASLSGTITYTMSCQNSDSSSCQTSDPSASTWTGTYTYDLSSMPAVEHRFKASVADAS